MPEQNRIPANSLTDLLSKQSVILSLVHEKLSITNLLVESLNSSNTPQLLKNHFFIFTTHIYLRSATIDLCALLHDNKSNEKNNFHRIYNSDYFSKHLNSASSVVAEIKNILDSIKDEITEIIVLRDKEYAHYDMQELSLNFSIEKLPLLNNLLAASKNILSICGKDVGIEHNIGLDYFESFKRLIS